MMIIVKLIGGLGNQMFQYALGRNLALLNDTELVLDISAYSQFPERSYGLNPFEIDAAMADKKIIKKISILTKLDKNIIQKVSVKNYLHLKQKEFDYRFRSDTVSKYDRHVYVDGYWQSEKYFLRIKDVIREDFSLVHLAADLKHALTNVIERSNAVSVHVRRGDYVSNNTSNEFHGLCGADYYSSAFNYIRKIIQDPIFFIFSDDINWCKANLGPSDDIFFVENNDPLSVYKDLYMMTRCKHHIIANSSFSWWGAWLGANEESKIVIAPEKWFNPDSKWYKEYSISTEDIVPVNWIKF